MRKTFNRALAGLAIALAGLFGTGAAGQGGGRDAILILDASGSMWGQIGGVNKIVIAKEVVEGLIRNLDEDQRLGFVAYGHRRKGDCGDIETLADVGARRDKVIEQLRALSPRGKTPLTASVEHAARALNYKKNAATVLLVSDGLENCGADPCALARTLEENGLNFTVHVIGFDVTEEERGGLQCIAEETGGLFLAADDAGELTEALAEIAAVADPEPALPPSEPVEAEPVPSEVILKATIMPGGPLIQGDLDWSVTDGAGNTVFSAEDAGVAETGILPGDYRVEVVWTGWRDGAAKTGAMDITIREQNVHVFTVPVDLALPVTLAAADETGEGQAVEITWSGPDALGATVSVARPEDPPGDFIFFFAADGASLETQASRKLAAPIEPGTYELRYTLNQPQLILARRPLVVRDGEFFLQAPEEAAVSTTIEVAWNGPATDGDLITLVPAGDERAFDNANYKPLRSLDPVVLTTPATPGAYEIRYVMYGGYTTYPGQQHSVQARASINVVDVGASLDGPATALGGSTIKVGWTGPREDWQDDYISVVEPGAEKFNRDSWAYISKGGAALNPAPIRVPAIEGRYELVYIVQPGKRIIARQPIDITRATATVDAPDVVTAGEAFEIAYSGDGFAKDRVVVVSAEFPDLKMWSIGTNYGFAATGEGTTGTVAGRVITEPGEYEARYVTGLQNQILARDRFRVVE